MGRTSHREHLMIPPAVALAVLVARLSIAVTGIVCGNPVTGTTSYHSGPSSLAAGTPHIPDVRAQHDASPPILPDANTAPAFNAHKGSNRVAV